MTPKPPKTPDTVLLSLMLLGAACHEPSAVEPLDALDSDQDVSSTGDGPGAADETTDATETDDECPDGECEQPRCGDGRLDADELCDGAAMDGQTCMSLGFPMGVLACASDYQTYELAGCRFGCEEQDVGTAVGMAVAVGSTVTADDDLPSTCGGGGGADHIVRFTAPRTGQFTFDTFGSGFDTVLSIFRSCEPEAQLVCDDDDAGTTQSRVVASLVAGETILVSVDGYSGQTGSFVLNIEDEGGACPVEQDLGSAVGPAVATGSTAGQEPGLEQSCSQGSAVDLLWWTAPATGTYSFDTSGSGFDTTLSAHEDCMPGAELGCSDDVGQLETSRLTLPLSAGQQVLLAIGGAGGASGSWALDIDQW
ncbi:MAG: hypothetical protein KDK70_11240 [Myxococcales bacterium]|nr:hypothetical protein [Myxococcales bacterium]